MNKNFHPLYFLAAIGAGGIAVAPFSFLNYTVTHGKGLIKQSDIVFGNLDVWYGMLIRILESVMVTFTLTHVLLMFIFTFSFLSWKKTEAYEATKQNPLISSALVAPIIAFIMTMNVFIGPVRYFIPQFAQHLQSFMLPALVLWALLWVVLITVELTHLKDVFSQTLDPQETHFGWLLHPFALAMLTVTGTGIAAIASSHGIAHTAAFMSLISGSFGVFLLILKVLYLFQVQMGQKTLPAKHLLPSVLVVVPAITLFAISAFRLGHYLESHMQMEMGAYFLMVIAGAFAFETWYLLFGMFILKDYFKTSFFKEFHVSQWGLVCPLVAYAVLGSFLYKVFIPTPVIYVGVLLVLATAVLLYVLLMVRQLWCTEKNAEGFCLLGKRK